MLKMISKILNIKNKILYKKREIPGHYIKNPNTFKPNYGKILKFKSKYKFEDDLKNMIKNI